MRWLTLTGLLLIAVASPALSVTIDGHIEPGEWQRARDITDFRQTQPLTGDPAKYPVQAWVEAVPQGLVVAVRVTQPASVPRTEQKVQRDFRDSVDRVNVNIDFNGDGLVGYNFVIASTGAIGDEVITNESRFNSDWDAKWQHGVSQDAQGWSVEILIPWSIAPMHAGVDGKRTIGINIDRVFAAIGRRASWPTVSYAQPRFLSKFAHITIPAYSQSLLAVTPYISTTYDNVGHTGRLRKGANLFWKPNGQFQLSATINPDFGQVESDDLVINFGATETFFSDKRPFFTENHGIFAFSLLDDNSQLVYSRRVGGPSDDGGGVSDIAGAIKLNGSQGATSYGILAADENGPAGRSFGALRVVHAFGKQNLGMLLTRVDHPFLAREATVFGIDEHWRPNGRLTIGANLVGSFIEQRGQGSDGLGATFVADYVMDRGWQQEWLAMHFGRRFQINDFGYLQRNDLNYAHWQVRKRMTDLPTDSRYRDHVWSARIDLLRDTEGLNLRRQLRIERDSDLRNGASEEIELHVNSSAWDDLLTRGHGALYLPPSISFRYERHYPRRGDWAWDWEIDIDSGGLAGNNEAGYELEFVPTHYVSDAFSVHVGLDFQRNPDWLVWQHDNLIGRFDQRQLELDTGFDWSIDNHQELRLKLQAIGLGARLRGAYLVKADGRTVPTDQVVSDFDVGNLGVQLRYRYELAPLSYLYVVYGRGGYQQLSATDGTLGAPSVLRDSFSLRNTEQWLVKLNYRFDM
ncbi:MAG: DUF5916 domain-containing protein [Rhodanobacteraceae bacterium]